MKAFPIPVVPFGPGSQAEDETLEYMTMPQGMDTFRTPALPEPEELAGHAAAHQVLRRALQALELVCREGGTRCVTLSGLGAADLALVNQVLGEGEVSARVLPAEEGGREVQVQESVFAGVWRVTVLGDGAVVRDHLEVGAVPQVLRDMAAADTAHFIVPALPEPLPPEVMNAPQLIAEIEDAAWRWRPGSAPHVLNLTLLPVSPLDIALIDHRLGTGRVLVLSRGYGNCRITNTGLRHGWRVVYYNSQDAVILNTVEITDMPQAACAAAEDLQDSHERLQDVLRWVEGAPAEAEALS
ncbi:hydrogenase expression/formation protein [Azohydromonas caseinilytica]|uniref:Hydrogenase expression/formation protein n=1 Tax=Azohydromonas caseinilytica TaxID=2728836 RepID=A0A848F6K6_9BURK|nr:hydrogenase expression/formation protein [Azohydromonas caseinilytica]NML15727.1 hydrogenase expression/formation protein [Azohydromonas caseinilytica]